MRNSFPQVQLPLPQTDAWEWQLEGACRSMPVNSFFPPRGLRGAALRAFERDAKRVCARCPVIERCLAYALDSNEPFGIWGGMTSSERYRRATEGELGVERADEPKPLHRIGPPKRPFKKLVRVD